MDTFTDFSKVLHSSLDAQTTLRCSRWATKYRVMGEPFSGPYSFLHHPWAEQPHDDNHEFIAVMKGAQLGWTEWAINRTLFTLDQLKRNVAYILPTERPSAVNFSKGRINTVCELSSYFATLFNKSNSETHKVTKYGNNLYMRGANSRSGIKEYSVSLMVLDEVDEMSFEAIGLAKERLSGQPDGKRQLLMLSTPSTEGKGIHNQFQDSTQSKFVFKCPYCNKYISFEYPQSLVITADSVTDPNIENSYYICYDCKHKIDQNSKQELYKNSLWIDSYPDRPIKGYQVSQLYSCAIGPNVIAKAEVQGRYNIALKTEFYNSKLGQAFVAEGASISQKDINECIGGHSNGDIKQKRDLLVTMGIDVGQAKHHVSIVGWNLTSSSRDIVEASEGKLLYFGTVDNFGEADDLMQMWQPRRIVIDAQPDTKNSIMLCKKYNGICFVCYYSLSKIIKQIVMGNVNDCSVSVSRTYWLDSVLGKVRNKSILFPSDLNIEYQNHLKALAKTYKNDDEGNPYNEFVKKESASDHYYHSLTYATIALGLCAGSGDNIE